MRPQRNPEPAKTPQGNTTFYPRPSMKDEIAAAAVKAAPPVAVTGSHVLFNLTLNDWVAIATLAYLALQGFALIRAELRKGRDK